MSKKPDLRFIPSVEFHQAFQVQRRLNENRQVKRFQIGAAIFAAMALGGILIAFI